MCINAMRLARYGGLAELRELSPHAVGHYFAFAVTPGAEPRDGGAAVHVDISTYFQRWVQLMECHKTQLRTRDYIELQTARARLLGVQAGVEYAQALFMSDHLLVKTLAELPPSIRLF
jgi:LmbE family N-acetylglucosaminyl deacetylase